MLTKFFVYLRVGPILSVACQYALLVGGVAFVALAVFASLFVPAGDGDDDLKRRDPSAWRRESQTLTGRYDAPTIRVPVPKEMNTYYNSLLNDPAAAAQLNDDLCDRLGVVHEVGSPSGTDSEFCYDDDDDDERQRRRIIV